MISLRKAMNTQVEEVLQSTLSSYGDVIAAVADAGAEACPPAGEELKESLLKLKLRLSADASLGAIAETEQLVKKELQSFGERASHFYEEKTDEVREILGIVAKAASQVGDRDQRYAKQFGTLTDQLQATAKLSDLSTIRRTLAKSTADLKSCVTKMAEDGQESIMALRAQMSVYQSRLDEVERIACQDALTGLTNRRKVELQLESKTKQAFPFCVIYIDLNGFKEINDSLGHAAGDDLLKQFSGELRSAFRDTDVVGRWGGDEFVVLVDGDLREGQTRMALIEKWVDGEYSVATNSGARKVNITAAAGMASLQTGDTPTTILQRADAAMYRHKASLKAGQPVR